MSSPGIIYENADFLVVNKPSGLMVHGVRVKDEGKIQEPTLVDWLLKKYPEIASVGDDPEQRPGIVHRLDKDTSGVMVVARNQATFQYLKKQFQGHEINKVYLAIVSGKLKNNEGIIDAPIGILTGSTRRSVHSKKMVKEAVTEYRVLKSVRRGEGDEDEFSLLEVRPKTGRTHQIRVHLSSIGHPIVGDRLYGPKKYRGKTLPEDRLMLHALSIEFVGVDGKRLRFETELPGDFGNFLGR